MTDSQQTLSTTPPTQTGHGRLIGWLPFFYGWVIVAAGGTAYFCAGPGQASVIGTFVEPMLADLGLSRSVMSGAFTVGTLVAALAMGPIGRATDRWGGRVILLCGAIGLGLTCLGMASVSGPIELALGFTALRLMVQGPLALTTTTLVAQWFVAQRGRAQSLMALGMTANFACYPFLTQFLIDQVGWRATWLLLGGLTWTLLVPMGWLVRSRPEEVGLRPDGHHSVTVAAIAPTDAPVTIGLEPAWTAQQATRTPTFWLMTIAIAVTWLLGAGLNFHQVALLTEHGLSAQLAASIFTITAIVSLPATFVAGHLVDRFSARWLLVGMLLLQTMAAWLLAGATTPLLAFGFGALKGILNGLSNVLGAVVFATYYGRQHLGSIRGTTMVVSVAASALGALPLGLARDLLGTYDQAVLLLGSLPLLVAVAMRWVRPPGPPPAPPHSRGG